MAGWLSGRAPAWAEAGAAAPQPLERFVNTEQGYAVDVPAGWERIEKMGANALFEDPARRSTSLGVTVNPVRVADITAFGSLAAVGEKLLDAERKKDGYLSVEMVSTSTRTSGAATLYVYEYDLDSTRGRKRILNTVTITGSRLYILNAMYKCEKDDEACNSEAVVATVARLRGLASSFEVV
ncbi:hypothetical protein FOA52_005403 [Chlamydomonas sp. UWO 241]|nr:hypothetical protein FOA52_005403 [Chlamydomonas sp. UWO 241]